MPVTLSTPTTLIALLWRQQQIAERVLVIRQIGEELYRRSAILAEHITDAGRHLDPTVKSYNRMVDSFESRFLTPVRRFQEPGSVAVESLPTLRGEGERPLPDE